MGEYQVNADIGIQQNQIEALELVIHYLHARGVEHKTIYEGARITRDQWRGVIERNPSHANFAKVHNFLKSSSLLPDRVEAWIRPMFQAAFPGDPRYAGSRQFVETDPLEGNPFLRFADEGQNTLRDLFETYIGVYSVFRYSANLNYPAHPPREGRIDITAEREGAPAAVVRSAMEVVHDGASRWPVFRVQYRPQDRNMMPISHIKGILVPVSGHVYFSGVETEIRSPFTMVTPHYSGDVTQFTGMILRKHNKQRIIVSRLVFIKRPTTSFADECEKIGRFMEADLENEIDDDIRRHMLNDISYFGKSTLNL